MWFNDFKQCISGHFHHLLSITPCCLAPNVTSASSTSKSNPPRLAPNLLRGKHVEKLKKQEKKNHNAEAQRLRFWARVWINSRSLWRHGSNFDITDHWNPLDVRCLQEGGRLLPFSFSIPMWAMKALCRDTLKQAGVNVEPSNARAPLKSEGRRSPVACSTWPHL